MTQKATRLPSSIDRLKTLMFTSNQLYALSRVRIVPRSFEAPTQGAAAVGGGVGGSPNALLISGGTMIENIAFDPKLILVVDGRVDLAPGTDTKKNSSYILVTGQGTPDDIKFIDGAERNGQLLFYQGTNQQIQNIINANFLSISNIVGDGSTTVTVTLSNTGTLANGSSINVTATNNFDITDGIVANLVVNTSFTYERAAGASTTAESAALIQDGNILTGDGNTLILDSTLTSTNVAMMGLIFDITVGGGAWRVMFSNNVSAGGAGSQTPWLQQIEGAGFTLNEAGKIVIKPTQTDPSAAILELIRNDSTPNDNSETGKIFFKGPDSLGAIVNYGAIEVDADTVLNTGKQGQFKISAQHDNSLVNIIDYTGGDATFRFSSGVDVVRPNANGTKELGTSSFFWDDVFSETFTLRGSGGDTSGSARTVYADSAGMVFNMPSSAPVFTHSVNNEIFSLLSNGNFEIRTELNNGPTLRLRNNDQTPTDNDVAATILFTGETNTLVEATYGAIEVTMDDVTNTSKQAQLKIQAQKDNSLLNIFDYTGVDATLRISSAVDVMRPNANGTKELGNSSFFWDDVFTETISFRGSGGDTSSTKNTIYADTGGIIMNVPASDSFTVLINNIRAAEFNVNGPIFNSTTTNQCNAFFSAANKTAVTDGLITSMFFQGLNSSSSSHNYALIQVRTPDKTDGSEDGQMEFQLSQNGLGPGQGSSVNILELNSNAGVQEIGFFGVTPVIQPDNWIITNFSVDRTWNASSVTLAALGQIVASIVSDLNDLGLFDASIS